VKTNFMCAIKKMPKYFDDESIVEQLIREIKIQSFLDHPNICQLYTFFQEGDFVYLLIELCNSGNVYSMLRKKESFREEKVKSIIRQVCYAIEYLHEHDIIHRDIKP
jgi:polo-like kinase 4